MSRSNKPTDPFHAKNVFMDTFSQAFDPGSLESPAEISSELRNLLKYTRAAANSRDEWPKLQVILFKGVANISLHMFSKHWPVPYRTEEIVNLLIDIMCVPIDTADFHKGVTRFVIGSLLYLLPLLDNIPFEGSSIKLRTTLLARFPAIVQRIQPTQAIEGALKNPQTNLAFAQMFHNVAHDEELTKILKDTQFIRFAEWGWACSRDIEHYRYWYRVHCHLRGDLRGGAYTYEECQEFYENLGTTRMTELFKHFIEAKMEPPPFPGATFIIVRPLEGLLRVGYFPFNIAVGEELAIALLQLAWKKRERETEEEAETFDLIVACLFLSMQYQSTLSPESPIWKLMVHPQFAPLMARTLIMSAKEADGTVYIPILSLLKLISTCMATNGVACITATRNAVLKATEPMALQVLDLLGDSAIAWKDLSAETFLRPPRKDRFKDVARPHRITRVDDMDYWSERCCWLNFIHSLGIDDDDLREKKQREMTGRSGGLIGCSWAECPLYHIQTGTQMLLCQNCLKVQYCDEARCQKSHWYKGGHKDDCKKLTGI